MHKLPDPNHVDVWAWHWPAYSNIRFDFDALLSVAEREQLGRLRFKRDRIAYASARAALRLILAEYLDSTADAVQFNVNAHGKPYINGSSVQFSVSHSVDSAVFAVAEGSSVGIDLEFIRSDLSEKEIASQFFTRNENDWLEDRSAESCLTDFFRLWVVKEALVKCIGLGLSVPLADCEVQFLNSQPHGICWRGHEDRTFAVRELKVWDGFTAALVLETTGADSAEGISTSFKCMELAERSTDSHESFR